MSIKSVTIEIRPPDAIKIGHYQLWFNTGYKLNLTSIGTTTSYNSAISEICKSNNLMVIHQTGTGTHPGVHMWEVWTKTSEETLKELLPAIHKRARQIYNQFYKMKAFHYSLKEIKMARL